MTRTPPDASGYPQRAPYFAQRFIRLLLKTCAANAIGQDAFSLLVAIATTEDAKRYRGPVSFHVGQLLPILGFAKWERLDAARKAAVAAGWLHYCPPRQGSRDPGLYWVTVPDDAGELPDTPLDEPGPIATAYHRGYQDGKAGRPPKLYPDAGDSCKGLSPDAGYSPGDSPGYSPGVSKGEHSNLTPYPKNSSCPDRGPDGSKGSKRRKREPSFLPDDLAAARWIWERIEQMQPGRRRPNLDKWANTIRLMREQDGRTCDQIRALFARVQADDFWRLNVLSPDKLRAKWDDLTLKLGADKSSKQQPAPSIYKPLRPLDDD